MINYKPKINKRFISLIICLIAINYCYSQRNSNYAYINNGSEIEDIKIIENDKIEHLLINFRYNKYSSTIASPSFELIDSLILLATKSYKNVKSIKLSLDMNYSVDRDLSRLKQFKHLENLSFSTYKLTYKDYSDIAQIETLKKLTITGITVFIDSVLYKLKGLEILTIYTDRFSMHSSNLEKLSSLRELYVFGRNNSEVDLKPLFLFNPSLNLKSNTSSHPVSIYFNTDFFKSIRKIKNLKALFISADEFYKVWDENPPVFPDSLEFLGIESENLDSIVLNQKLENLKLLVLSNQNNQKKELKYFINLDSLKSLNTVYFNDSDGLAISKFSKVKGNRKFNTFINTRHIEKVENVYNRFDTVVLLDYSRYTKIHPSKLNLDSTVFLIYNKNRNDLFVKSLYNPTSNTTYGLYFKDGYNDDYFPKKEKDRALLLHQSLLKQIKRNKQDTTILSSLYAFPGLLEDIYSLRQHYETTRRENDNFLNFWLDAFKDIDSLILHNLKTDSFLSEVWLYLPETDSFFQELKKLPERKYLKDAKLTFYEKVENKNMFFMDTFEVFKNLEFLSMKDIAEDTSRYSYVRYIPSGTSKFENLNYYKKLSEFRYFGNIANFSLKNECKLEILELNLRGNLFFKTTSSFNKLTSLGLYTSKSIDVTIDFYKMPKLRFLSIQNSADYNKNKKSTKIKFKGKLDSIDLLKIYTANDIKILKLINKIDEITKFYVISYSRNEKMLFKKLSNKNLQSIKVRSSIFKKHYKLINKINSLKEIQFIYDYEGRRDFHALNREKEILRKLLRQDIKILTHGY